MKRFLATLFLSLLPSIAMAQPTNALTSVMYIPADGDCDNDACTNATRIMCRESVTATTLYACNTSTGFYVPVTGGGTPGGSNTLVQFNDSGAFGGDAGLAYDKTADTLTVAGSTAIVLSAAGATVDGKDLDLVPAHAKIVHICPSGCEYTTLNAACAGETSTAANPITYRVHAGLYAAANTMCNGEDNFSIIGDGMGVTVLQSLDPGFGVGAGNDCTAEPKSCKGAINVGASTDFEIAHLTTNGNRTIYANPGGTGGGNVYIHDVDMETTTTNGDEDCFFGSNFASGTKFYFNDNICKTRADGYTVNSSSNFEVYSRSNVTYLGQYPTSFGTLAAAHAYRAIPCRYVSEGDTVIASGALAADHEWYGWYFTGEDTGCASGVATISSPVVQLTDSTGAGNAPTTTGIYVASTATELTTLEIVAPRIFTNVTDVVSAVSYAVNLQNATTTARVNGGVLYAQGGDPASSFDINTPGTTTVKVIGTTLLGADGGATRVQADDQRRIKASIEILAESSEPHQGIVLTNNDAGNNEGSPYIRWNSSAQSTETAYANVTSGGIWSLLNSSFQPLIEADTARGSFKAYVASAGSVFLGNAPHTNVYIGDGTNSDFNTLIFNSGTTDAVITWTDSANTMSISGAEVLGLGGITTGATLDAAGEFTVDTSANQWCYYSGGAVRCLTPTLMETLPVISPTTTTDPVWLKAPWPMTVSNIDCIVDPEGTAESVVITVRECDASGDSCAGLDGATTITCGNTNTADDGALSNSTIDAGDWIDIDTGTVTGTVTRLAVTIRYTQDRQ